MSGFRAVLSPFARIAVFFAIATPMAFLTGCALESTVTTSSKPDPTVFAGKLIGGENPVAGATISFYETSTITTGSSGTGTTTGGFYAPKAPLTALGSTLTDAYGNFSFASPLACASSSDFVYATAAAGNSGSGNNPNLLLMSAVGSCANFGSSTFVTINELSTIAAAYALQGFTSVSGTYSSGDVVMSYSISGNVVTMVAKNTLAAGDSVTLSGFPTSTFFNGQTYAVLSASTTSFTFSYTSADVATTTEPGKVAEMDAVSQYTVASGIATIQAPNSLVAGQQVTLAGFTTSTFLNGNYTVQPAGLSSTQFEVAISHTDVTTTAESGFADPLITATVPVVSVVATATNYATVSSAAASPSAAGLSHAFDTAANLKPAAQTYLSSTLQVNNAVILPSALIYALGNSIQACVNTTGGAATGATMNDGTHCGQLFSYTTNPITAVVPTNTVSALLNIARFPTQNVANICGLSPATGAAFAPAVACSASSPLDWTIALSFSKGTGNTNGSTACSGSTASGNTNGICYPINLSLDASDNVFVLNSDAALGGTAYQSNLTAFSNAGANLWATAINTANTKPTGIAADGLGNIFYTNDGAQSGTENIFQLETTHGTAVQTLSTTVTYPYSLAVDASNNVWMGRDKTVSSTKNIYEFVRGTTGNPIPYSNYAFTNNPTSAGYAYQLAFDSNANLWIANNLSSAVAETVLPRSYTGTEVTSTGFSAVNVFGTTVDASGNAWWAAAGVLYKTVPNSTTAITTAATTTAGTYTPAGGTATLRNMAVDGASTIWVVDYNANFSAVVGYTSTATTPAFTPLRPCIATTTACPNLTASPYGPGVYYPRTVAVDSAGNLWIPDGSNNSLIEIIGAAVPSWPLLGDLKPGVMP